MRVFTRRRRLHRGGAARSKHDPLPLPPPPPPSDRPRLQCGTLGQLSEFDLGSLAWLRDAPALAALQGEEGEDAVASSDAEFWQRVNDAGFPPERNLCTLECKDAQIFFQTMENWGVDLDDAPDAFLQLIFSPKRNVAFNQLVKSAPPGPGERAVRQKMLDAHTRFTELLSVWGTKGTAASLVRTAIAIGHPRFDKYVLAQVPEIVAATKDVAAATTATRVLLFPVELALDAVGSDRADWLKWLMPAAAAMHASSNEFYIYVVMRAIEQHSDTCLAMLVETIPLRGPDAKDAWIRLRANAAVYGSDVALQTIHTRFIAEYGEVPEEGEDADSLWTVDGANPTTDVALDGNAARLKLLVQMGCPADEFVFAYAVASGDAATLAYCRELAPNVLGDNAGAADAVLSAVFESRNNGDGAVQGKFRKLRPIIDQVKRGAQFVRSVDRPLTPYLGQWAVELCLESIDIANESLLAVHSTGMAWPTNKDWFAWQFGEKEHAKCLPALKWLHEHGLQMDAAQESALRAVHGDALVDSVVVRRNAVRK